MLLAHVLDPLRWPIGGSLAPGASGYAPGQEMQNKGSVKGTSGASGYAPGHATTGSSTRKHRDYDSKTKNKY
jgi:hypothetical protein